MKKETEHIWDRQQGESDKAYAAFKIYCEQGEERGVRKVAQECNKSASLIGRWSTKWKWVERATEYDSFVFQQDLKQNRKKYETYRANKKKTLEAIRLKIISEIAHKDMKNTDAKSLIKMLFDVYGMEDGIYAEMIRENDSNKIDIATKEQQEDDVVIIVPDNGRKRGGDE